MIRETIEASNKTSTTLEGFALRCWCWHREGSRNADIYAKAVVGNVHVLLACISLNPSTPAPSLGSFPRHFSPLPPTSFRSRKRWAILFVWSDKLTRARDERVPVTQWASYLDMYPSPKYIIQFCFPPVHNGEGDFFRIYWISGGGALLTFWCALTSSFSASNLVWL